MAARIESALPSSRGVLVGLKAMRDYRAFSLSQAAELTGLSVARLRRWARDGFIPPEFNAKDADDFGFYSFRDLVGLRTVAKLLERKVNPKTLKGLNRWFLRRDEYPHPWSSLKIEVWGDEAYFFDTVTDRYLGSKPPGQALMQMEIETAPIEVDVESQVLLLQRRKATEGSSKLEQRGGARGRAYIKGTRVPTGAIGKFAAAGYTPEQIQKEYPDLTLAEIAAAIEFERGGRHAS